MKTKNIKLKEDWHKSDIVKQHLKQNNTTLKEFIRSVTK